MLAGLCNNLIIAAAAFDRYVEAESQSKKIKEE